MHVTEVTHIHPPTDNSGTSETPDVAHHLTCIKADINVPHKNTLTLIHIDGVLIGEAPVRCDFASKMVTQTSEAMVWCNKTWGMAQSFLLTYGTLLQQQSLTVYFWGEPSVSLHPYTY